MGHAERRRAVKDMVDALSLGLAAGRNKPGLSGRRRGFMLPSAALSKVGQITPLERVFRLSQRLPWLLGRRSRRGRAGTDA